MMLAKSSISCRVEPTRRPAAVSASAMCCGRSPSFQAWLRKMSNSAAMGFDEKHTERGSITQ